jgi:hypothetical protein
MSHAMRIHAMAGQVISVLAPWNPALEDLCSVFALLLAEHCEMLSHTPGLPHVGAKHLHPEVLTRITERLELFSVACAESWRLQEQSKAIDPANTGDVMPTPDAKGRFTENLVEVAEVADRLIAMTGAKPPREPQ